ncbi:MAG: YfiR family protein [gamma proteobacterium symbiont of Taylorina sp.]|nr:YfiR family protein [gamma proteobacterium symbiont of Taylorina sp.]
MKYKIKKILISLLICIILSPLLPTFAANEELALQAVFLGRFAKFIDWPNNDKDKFVITLIDENPFGKLLDELYKDKTIHDKSIEIHYVTRIDDIKDTDILFITLDNKSEMQKVIKYAQKQSILTISEHRGFAQRGGIIQLNFVMQKTQLKINYDSAVKSNIKISAPLLAIAQHVIKGEVQ